MGRDFTAHHFVRHPRGLSNLFILIAGVLLPVAVEQASFLERLYLYNEVISTLTEVLMLKYEMAGGNLNDWSGIEKALESIKTPELVEIYKKLARFKPPTNG